jgi:hypothetical protein
MREWEVGEREREKRGGEGKSGAAVAAGEREEEWGSGNRRAEAPAVRGSTAPRA